MTGRGRRHHHAAQRDEYSKAEVAARGLACPFAKSNPETYVNADVCRPGEGFKETRLLFEHIWRKHTRFFRCGFCHVRWNTAKSRKKVTQEKERHWQSCEDRLSGEPYQDGPDTDGTELLTWNQLCDFATIRSEKNVGAKLEALYRACGKPAPETYYATEVVVLGVYPQLAYEPGARAATQPGQQRPASHGEGIFEGFSRPPPGTPRPPRKRPTADNVSKATAALQAADRYQVSGADRPPDRDSGYSSMPCELSGRTLVQDCFQYGNSDAVTYLGTGSLATWDQSSLLGLDLPRPGVDDAGEPVNMWDDFNLDAEPLVDFSS